MVQKGNNEFIAAYAKGVADNVNYEKKWYHIRLWWNIKVKYNQELAVQADRSNQRNLAFRKSMKQKNIYHIVWKTIIYDLRMVIRTMLGDFQYKNQFQTKEKQYITLKENPFRTWITFF